MNDLKLILLSSDIEPKSGWGRYTYEFCQALCQKGVFFELHLPYNCRVPEGLLFGTRVRLTLPSWSPTLGWGGWRLVSLLIAGFNIARQFLKSENSSRTTGVIVHALVEYYGVVAWWISRRTRWPFGLSFHGTYAVTPFRFLLDRFWFRRVVREANFLVSVSRYTAEQLRLASNLSKLPIEVIHNGVSLPKDLGSQEEARLFLRLPQKIPVLLSVCALKERKGIDVLLRAFALVHQKRPESLLLLVGSGDQECYKSLARELGVVEGVRFMGVVDDRTLQRCYEACDVFVMLPRRVGTAFEGFGLVYLEANAWRKPVVGADSGGVAEAVRHMETGLLVGEGDWEGAAQAILKLLEDQEIAQNLSEQGQRWAEEHDWNQVIEAYLRLYRKVQMKRWSNQNAPSTIEFRG